MRGYSSGSFVLLVLSIVAQVAAGPSLAAAGTVFPTGIFPGDVERVQAALDRGGVVLLKSTDVRGRPTAFNFGPAEPGVGGTASITRDVVILGEQGRSGRTTIRGGSVPFASSARVHLSLINVKFEAPLEAALALTASAGALVIGNEVTGVVGAPFFDVTDGPGMKFIGSGDPSAFSGHIVVSGNVIRDLRAIFADGLVFQEVAARVTIAFNRIERVASNGILMHLPGGDVTILSNVITPGPATDPIFSIGNGIQLLGTAGGSYRIERNTITCENPLADGLVMWGGFNLLRFEPGLPIEGTVIVGNEISMSGSCCGAITLFDSVSFSTISQNILRGTAEWGFGLLATGAVPDTEAVGNTFAGNDISQLAVGTAHVFFFDHAHDNVFRGPSGTVVDLGDDNVFTD
jgi:hypothetical protein